MITLFPEVFAPLDSSIIKRAREKELVHIFLHHLRDFTHDRHRTVDDAPYGGGSGMVLKIEPIYEALQYLSGQDARRGRVILLSPQGKMFDQDVARSLLTQERLILICGHYEGIDERVAEYLCDDELSIGDYVLTGGELAAMVVMDAVIRLIPGVIDEESALYESFNEGMLDYPHYTRPRDFRGMTVPEVLLSGNHREIERWRNEQKREKTGKKRPDLIKAKRDALEQDYTDKK